MLVDSTNKLAPEGAPRKSNPLYGDRKLKLATFGSNIKSGCAITSGDGGADGLGSMRGAGVAALDSRRVAFLETAGAFALPARASSTASMRDR